MTIREKTIVMKRTGCVTIVVWWLAAATAWGVSPKIPKELYGASIGIGPASQFAVAATTPQPGYTRSQYVIVAKASDDEQLQLLAWEDTTSALVALQGQGLGQDQNVQTVAVAGLDPNRVVTADVTSSGVLSLTTWQVGPSGVKAQQSYSSGASIAGSQDVAMASTNTSQVVVAYETPDRELVVESFSIDANGLPTPGVPLAKGPKAFDASIAAVTSSQVITAAAGYANSLWVDTWQIDSGGVKQLDEVEIPGAAVQCSVGPRPQAVAVGAGESIGPAPGSGVSVSAFTPVTGPYCDLQVYYWSIASNGSLTRQSTPSPISGCCYYDVAASMLARNIPITSEGGSTGDNHVLVQWWTGSDFEEVTGYAYGDPFGQLNLTSTNLGTNLAKSLYAFYNAYFVSAGQFGPPEGEADGTLSLNVLSYPEEPLQ